MCFSAKASFGAGIFLTIAGVITILQVKKPSHLLFASIPLLFAIQQTTEGFLWLSLTHPSFASWHLGTTYLFLIFAQIIWPFFTPLSMAFLEKDAVRKKILFLFTLAGMYLSLKYTISLFGEQAQSKIIGYHIDYCAHPASNIFFSRGMFYFIVTIIPAFVSTAKKMRIMGILILISFIFTQLFYTFYVLSVWCFFAAIISCMVFLVIRDEESVIFT